ncbi:AAA domain-containing protein [Actinoallomurus spadix]|uniref:AAA family ATPase n=1 Tax=Actinoallomurus spadix TaxID=79912 RepID=A0ABP3HB32_9ACTN|nr:AAA domain-containing protein [Actinoallomurus spadix]MCO5984971.1 AAA domain-containing protein [Actinoallomurus spadix]
MPNVDLPGPLVLVPSPKLDTSLREHRDRAWLPAGAEALIKDLNARPGGIPVTLAEPRAAGKDWGMLVYGRTYVALMYVSKRGDAYFVASVRPLWKTDHRNLVNGHLILRPRGWRLAYEFRRVPEGMSAHWPAIDRAWQDLLAEQAARQGAPRLDDERSAYLATLSALVDAEQRIRTETAPRMYPYRAVAPTGDRRYGTNAFYDFDLVGGQVPEERTFVQVHGEPELRGQVTRVTGARAAVRFHQAVGWDRVQGQGELEETPNSTVYDKQREAIAVLRDGQARNPGLLPALVDHEVGPIPATDDRPSEALDEDQTTAFRKALHVPDVLLVLGPPGTGKTRTISQIADACAERGERVLVTSNSHRAVDNVLPRLPRHLVAVRVGAEGSVTSDGQAYLLERQASDLVQRVLVNTSPALAAYTDLPHAERWAAELDASLVRQAAAAEEVRRAEADLRAARQAAGGALRDRVDGLAAELTGCEREIARAREQIERWSTRRDRAAARVTLPVIGRFFDVLRRRHERRMTAGRQREREVAEAAARTRAELAGAERELEAVTRDDPAVRKARATHEESIQRHGRCREESVAAARFVHESVRAVPGAASPPEDPGELREWAAEWLPVLSARGRLLAEWHEKISTETDDLYPELIRYAEVVAATCIGAASRPELADVDFDVAIVDEAGQIGTNTALVPLVRARRAVLVGDHKQLPPFLDTELEEWGAADDDPRVRDLLAKSVLELLWDGFPDSHRVLLSRQRRMPATIGDFISAEFYGGRLRTDVRREHRDPLFGSPMAFIDTSALPTAQRREQRTGLDHVNLSGYTNPAEAELIALLAAFYHRLKVEWAVILPYKAQVKDVRARIDRLTGREADTLLNVGTVDAFQGGERDVILHGFTRSNERGNVGFLAELRRANVAFTRAKQQLVLVGDLRTLTGARDPGFRALARSLHDYLRAHGEIRPYAEIRSLLGDA